MKKYFVESSLKHIDLDNIYEVRKRIEQGADVNESKNNGETPLMRAKTADVVKLLLDHGADVHALDRGGRTALFYVQDADAAALLLKYGARVNAKDNSGRTPLMSSANADVTKVLIDRGANVNDRDPMKRTPLMHLNSAMECNLLIDHGAEINAIDINGKTALINACRMDCLDTAYDKIKSLLDRGANANIADTGGITALMNTRKTEIIKLLIDHKADVNSVDHDGRSAFIHYADSGYYNLSAKELLDVPCNPFSGMDILQKYDSVKNANNWIEEATQCHINNQPWNNTMMAHALQSVCSGNPIEAEIAEEWIKYSQHGR